MTDTVVLNTLVAKGSLVFAESDTGNVATKVLRSKGGKSTPSTANIEETVFGLEIELVADESEFIVLKFFESFSPIGIHNNTRSIDHPWTQEPTIEIVSS